MCCDVKSNPVLTVHHNLTVDQGHSQAPSPLPVHYVYVVLWPNSNPALTVCDVKSNPVLTVHCDVNSNPVLTVHHDVQYTGSLEAKEDYLFWHGSPEVGVVAFQTGVEHWAYDWPGKTTWFISQTLSLSMHVCILHLSVHTTSICQIKSMNHGTNTDKKRNKMTSQMCGLKSRM